MHAHRRLRPQRILFPHKLVYLGRGIDASRVLHQQPQDVELDGRERDLVAVDRHAFFLLVEHDGADGVDVRLLLFLFRPQLRVAAELRPDARQHLHGVKGLCDVVIRADVQAQDLVAALALGREQDDGHVALFAQLRRRGDAVELGHHDVHQDQMDVVLLHDLQRLAPVARFEQAVVPAGEIDLQRVDNVLFVVTNQNVIHFLTSYWHYISRFQTKTATVS